MRPSIYCSVAATGLFIAACASASLPDETLPKPAVGGERDRITPGIDIVSPANFAVLKANTPIAIHVAYTAQYFDFCNACATVPPADTYGTVPQISGQGHGHAYLTAPGLDGPASEDAPSFCVLQRTGNGDAKTTCPGLPPGVYELRVDLTTNAHAPRLKAGPRKKPPNALVRVIVVDESKFDQASQQIPSLLEALMDSAEAAVGP